MGISDFIKESVLRPRLEKGEVLVVYDDAAPRYREICNAFEDGSIRVIDASESSLISRLEAMRALCDLGSNPPTIKGLLIYVPVPKSVTEEQKLVDPFSVFTEAGGVFPRDDGDSYKGICLKAKPGHEAEIIRIFEEDPNPSFAVIDAVGGGNQWPQLRAALKAESTKDILLGLMCPTDSQLESLKQTAGWTSEVKDFLHSSIALDLKTKAKTWQPISDEIWRYVTFSEFVFDLPADLPPSLTTVPKAPPAVRDLIEGVCDHLRQNLNTRSVYVERAEAIENELRIPEACAAIEDLGVKDAFPFEERSFLKRAVSGLLMDNPDITAELVGRHGGSVWLHKGESQQQWGVVDSALKLVASCQTVSQSLPSHQSSAEKLVGFYVEHIKETDRLQREFEQSVHAFVQLPEMMVELIDFVRSRYRSVAEKVQASFTKSIETSGWPVEGFIANGEIFEKFVAPVLADQGAKCAYIWVDALRFELGSELERLLGDGAVVELKPALANLPTITPVGMASLLPQASYDLSLDFDGSSLIPKLGGQVVSNVSQRMSIFRKLLNDRFEEMPLSEFLKPKKKIGRQADLLVLRSTEIDALLETDPAATLSNIPTTLNQLRSAVNKLHELGFARIVIASDHGFFLNLEPEPGDVCAKPGGDWKELHNRFMIGNGTADSHNFVMTAERLGIRGNFSFCAGPKTMAPYRSGEVYFHGGLSLQEAVVPVLIIKPKQRSSTVESAYRVELNYKNGVKRITTRVPVVIVSLYATSLFAGEEAIEVLIQARDKEGIVVGTPRPGGDVNPATGTISLGPMDARQVTISMDPAFEGSFTLEALNPLTGACYERLDLKTDYLM